MSRDEHDYFAPHDLEGDPTSEAQLGSLWDPFDKEALERTMRHESGHVAATWLLAHPFLIEEVWVEPNDGCTEFPKGWLKDQSNEEMWVAITLAGIYAQHRVGEKMSTEDWIELVKNRPIGDGDDDVDRVQKRGPSDEFVDRAKLGKLVLDRLSEFETCVEILYHAFYDKVNANPSAPRWTLSAAELSTILRRPVAPP